MAATQNHTSPPGTFDVSTDAGNPTNGVAAAGAAPAPPRSEPEEPYRLRGPRRRLALIFGITATTLITALAVTLLYVKWYRTVEYDSMIIVIGEPGWEGATATVTSPSLPGGGLTGTLEPVKNLMLRFHVPQGAYTLTVTDKGGKVLAERTQKNLPPQHVWWATRAPANNPPPTPDKPGSTLSPAPR